MAIVSTKDAETIEQPYEKNQTLTPILYTKTDLKWIVDIAFSLKARIIKLLGKKKYKIFITIYPKMSWISHKKHKL